MNLYKRALIAPLLSVTLIFIGGLSDTPAWACGGFFCNVSTPVNQSAERILFARDAEANQISMHIQIQYSGPSTEFGWILPTAPDVETQISSEALFSALDILFRPVFQLNYIYPDDCMILSAEFDGAESSNNTRDDGGVQVLSREEIGPYDRAILSAESVEDLRAWLNEQEFQIPDALDPKFQPYIEAGAVFVVIKLLPGNDSGDIVPLSLTFSGDRPSIPIIPTSVAANPDMGIIAHVLDSARAVPVNYRHVQINEAAIDWVGGGVNYPDVVSQAVDEAGGRAFTTDFAGPHENQLSRALSPYDEQQLSAIARARTVGELTQAVDDRTNPDFQRVVSGLITLPENATRSEFFRCPSCYDGGSIEVDGAAVADRLRQEVNPVYEQITELATRLPYLTRLYTTLSADEMDRDPIFSINPDMDDVSNLHVAETRVTCDAGLVNPRSITLADGRSYDVEDATPTQRQEGETVRGADLPAAAVIEQAFETGLPEMITSVPVDDMTPTNDGEAGAEAGAEAGTDSGSSDTNMGNNNTNDSGCEQRSVTSTMFTLSLMLFSLLGLWRRRESQES